MGRGLKVAEFRWLFCCYEDFGLGRIEVAQSHVFTDEQAKEILRKHNPELRRVFLIAGAPNLGTCSPSAPVRQIEGLHERRISGSS